MERRRVEGARPGPGAPADDDGAGGPDELPRAVLAAVRRVCGALPEAYEEPAWVGVRWRIRAGTFAHLLPVVDGRPPSYGRALERGGCRAGAVTVLSFRSAGPELEALGQVGRPFHRVQWGRPVVLLEADALLDGRVGADELAELITESYCLLAPKRLAARVGPPPL